MRERILKVIALLLCVTLLVGITSCGPSQVEGQKKTITIGTVSFPGSVNLFVETGAVYWGIMLWIYDGLYQLGTNDEAIPNLAEKIEVSEDGKTYTFKIREAKFHDGAPLTAYDGEFSFNYIIDNELGYFTSYTGPVEEVKALDERTLQITLDDRINREWLDYNTFLWVPFLPKHIWENIKAEDALGALPVEKFVGSGPFKLTGFSPDEYIRLEATDEAKEKMKVKIDEVIIKAYADSAMMLEDLQAGNIDGATMIDKKAAPVLRENSKITLHQLPAVWLEDVIFNSFPNAYAKFRTEHPHPALKNVKLREAMDWLLDEDKAAKIALGEFGIPGNQFLPPYYGDYCNTELPRRGYDPEKAKEILDSIDYIDRNGDGLRETAEGQPLEFDVWIPSTMTYAVDVATMWALEAKQAGIELNISTMDADSLTAQISPNGEFDIAFWDWGGEVDPNFLLSVLTSEQAAEGGWSDCGFSNPEYDSLYALQLRAPTKEERKDIIWKMQEIIHREIPYIVYAYYGEIDVTRNDKVKINPEVVSNCYYGVLSRPFALQAEKVSQ